VVHEPDAYRSHDKGEHGTEPGVGKIHGHRKRDKQCDENRTQTRENHGKA
jgi:hypothetical protein